MLETILTVGAIIAMITFYVAFIAYLAAVLPYPKERKK